MVSKSIRDQLAVVAPGLKRSTVTVRPVSQVVLTIEGNDEAFGSARSEILKWLQRRAGPRLPPEAWEGRSFDLSDVGAHPLAAVAIDDPQYWATRLDYNDEEVPQRVWTTEVALGRRSDRDFVVGCRLTCSTRGEERHWQPSIPGLVRQIVEKCATFLDSRSLRTDPWLVRNEDDVDALVDLLNQAKRRCDVYVFSLPEWSENPVDAAASADTVHRQTLGTAHVALITGPASFHLTDRVGKEFSVFKQAVRTYRPGFDVEQDGPFRHPLALPNRIEHWKGEGVQAFQSFLICQALQRSVSFADIEDRVPPFAFVRRIAAQRNLDRARNQGVSEAELLELADSEITKLRAALDEEKATYDGLLKVAEAEREEAQQEEAAARAEQHRLAVRIRLLEQQVASRELPQPEPVLPKDLESLESWSSQYLSGSVFLHSRAFVGAKKSVFEDVGLVYKALLVLRDFYVPMRRVGGMDKKAAFDDRCRELGIVEEATFSEGNWGHFGDEYRIRYDRKFRQLDRHLKAGNARDPRRCFRLYFFWDADEGQVVVGWLPSHLTTRAT